ncbi:MAG: hypothetical protein Q7T80_15915 [Methanoregula sp.]|nr:hypothetical protein [Methanoregula sp.]
MIPINDTNFSYACIQLLVNTTATEQQPQAFVNSITPIIAIFFTTLTSVYGIYITSRNLKIQMDHQIKFQFMLNNKNEIKSQLIHLSDLIKSGHKNQLIDYFDDSDSLSIPDIIKDEIVKISKKTKEPILNENEIKAAIKVITNYPLGFYQNPYRYDLIIFFILIVICAVLLLSVITGYRLI